MHLGWLCAGHRMIVKDSGHCPWPRQRWRTCPRLWFWVLVLVFVSAERVAVSGSFSQLALALAVAVAVASVGRWILGRSFMSPMQLLREGKRTEEASGGWLGLGSGSGRSSCRSGSRAANWAVDNWTVVEQQETCSVLVLVSGRAGDRLGALGGLGVDRVQCGPLATVLLATGHYLGRFGIWDMGYGILGVFISSRFSPD
jgi:hypothetical protein